MKGNEATSVGLACRVAPNSNQLIPIAKEVVKQMLKLSPDQYPKATLKSDKLDPENDKMIVNKTTISDIFYKTV